MKAACHLYANHTVAVSRNDFLQLSYPRNIRATGYPYKESLSDSQHIAALDSSGMRDPVNRTNLGDMSRDNIGLGCSACSTQPTNHRYLIEHDYSILDKSGIRQHRLFRKDGHRNSCGLQCADIARVLLPRFLDVEFLTGYIKQLAVLQRAADLPDNTVRYFLWTHSVCEQPQATFVEAYEFNQYQSRVKDGPKYRPVMRAGKIWSKPIARTVR